MSERHKPMPDELKEPKKTRIHITREGMPSVSVLVPAGADWYEVVQRCAREFGNPSKPIQTDSKYK